MLQVTIAEMAQEELQERDRKRAWHKLLSRKKMKKCYCFFGNMSTVNQYKVFVVYCKFLSLTQTLLFTKVKYLRYLTFLSLKANLSNIHTIQ